MQPVIESLFAIGGALGPIFFMIGLGYLLRRRGFPGETFWPAAERLTYFLLFPALLVHKLALAKLGDYAIAPLTGVIAGTLLLMTALLFLLRPLLGVDGPAFSSIYQGSLRFNTYVGPAAASALFQAPGMTVAALAIAILIPLVNVLCVAVLTLTVGGGGGLVRGLATNPLILACLAGIMLNAGGVGLPLGSASVLDILGRAALPLGLLSVGAALRLRVAFDRRRELGVTAALKLAALPALAYGLSLAVGLGTLETAIIVLFTALPGATSAYILARQLGGDAELMAAIVTIETGFSMLTLPAILFFLV
jgi:predicted permease